MLKTGFDKGELGYISSHQQTPLHNASDKGYFEIVKYLIEKGADVNSIWIPKSLNHEMNVFTHINNFDDPFYRRFEDSDSTISQMNILIENGMI